MAANVAGGTHHAFVDRCVGGHAPRNHGPVCGGARTTQPWAGVGGGTHHATMGRCVGGHAPRNHGLVCGGARTTQP